jgi:hypothetical protein
MLEQRDYKPNHKMIVATALVEGTEVSFPDHWVTVINGVSVATTTVAEAIADGVSLTELLATPWRINYRSTNRG